MTEQRTDDLNEEWARFWVSASGFWRGPRAWPLWLLVAALVGIVVAQLYVQFRFNYWNRDFFDGLEQRNAGLLQTQVMLLVPLCAASIALEVASVWGRMTVQRCWRAWLSTHVIDYWAEESRYARLARAQGRQKIPEYRIAQDVRPGPRGTHLETDGVVVLRQARPVVVRHTLGHRAQGNRIALRRIADALEPLRHPLQVLGSGVEKLGDLLP